ncbi:lipoprotein transmembrane [Croceibacterium mercuriale]|uniref:Lipoprotein transmembrane n=1 Tax=Croceibacterium mercuriale TaxID=1572751 RepID=A0A0B2BSG6_9SPHN|nr:DUF4136 domain-containing protein [Croceibacterium mercuriale]KHL24364.1 lipoprotein transmembrane [Croceibacterium mercuriale]
MSFLSKYSRTAKLATVPLLLLGVAACASPFRADVSRFQAQLPAPQGQTFAVVPEDPQLANSLEFATYSNWVAQEMQQLGYAPAPSADSATLLVRFDYGVDNGRERIRTTPGLGPWGAWGGGFGGYGGYGRFSRFGGGPWGYGWNPGFFGGGWGGGWGGGPDVRSYTVFTSGIDVKIDRVADGQRLFEGKAQAVSTSNRLQYLVPNLVEAMFTDFPGNSGETLRISIAPENQPVQRSR